MLKGDSQLLISIKGYERESTLQTLMIRPVKNTEPLLKTSPIGFIIYSNYHLF